MNVRQDMAIETIPTQELIDDRLASVDDIATCRLALAVGITHHRDGTSVQARLDTNQRIVEKIDAELARRGVGLVTV